MHKKTALIIGRFQPLHKGHVHAIRKAMRDYERVVIGIGSANKSDMNNPLSLQEREKILRAVFGNWIEVVGLEDFENDERWVRNVLKVADFDVAISGNERVLRLLMPVKTVERIKLYEPEKYSATKIRELIKKSNKWAHLVPIEALPIIELSIRKNPKVWGFT